MNKQDYLQAKQRLKAAQGSVQSRFSPKQEIEYFYILHDFCTAADDLGPIGSASRDAKLRKLWVQEPILAGIIYTQQARLSTMHWSITGPQEEAMFYSNILQNAGNGAGWDTEIKKWAQDYLTQSRGALFEKWRQGKNGPVVGIAHLDIGRCRLTGDPENPVAYMRSDGSEVLLSRDHVIHRCSMPSPAEEALGAGTCLVDRAIRAIKLLMALHKYEEDAFDDMPPEGIAAVTGMDWQTLQKALELWRTNKDSKNLTFKRVLWLCGNPFSTQPMNVNWIPFTQPPMNFNRRDVIDAYVNTLALAAGEDPTEFWLFVHPGATKGASMLLHEKGLSKGIIEMARVIERAINWEVLPRGLSFTFDYRDRTAEKLELQRQLNAAQVIMLLWRWPLGMTRGLIPDDIAIEMLVRHGLLTPDQAERISERISEPHQVGDIAITTDIQGNKQFQEMLMDMMSDLQHKLDSLEKEEEENE